MNIIETFSTSLANNSQLQENIIQHYQSYKSPLQVPHASHVFILPECRITLYNSHKILFQGKTARQEYQKWFKASVTSQSPSQTLSTYIGCDETGVGDYIAPLVACACYINPDIAQKLQAFKIQDSKQLTDAYIQKIAPEVKKIVPHSSIVLSNKQYNKLINQGYNSHAIKAIVHNKAVAHLITKNNLSTSLDIVMDQFASEANYRKYLKDIHPQFIPTIFATKAENKYLAVACASIIGRDHFLTKMNELNTQYQTTFPLGAGAHVDQFCIQFIQEHGEDTFQSLVKYHFANTKKILK